jgi:hypothetical protein
MRSVAFYCYAERNYAEYRYPERRSAQHHGTSAWAHELSLTTEKWKGIFLIVKTIVQLKKRFLIN